jgi:hypothetical protein
MQTGEWAFFQESESCSFAVLKNENPDGQKLSLNTRNFTKNYCLRVAMTATLVLRHFCDTKFTSSFRELSVFFLLVAVIVVKI